MARERMVTRTVCVTNVEAMSVNITTACVENIAVKLTGEYTDATQALKACKKLYENDTVKIVSIVNMTVEEVLYGMPEIEFIALAKVLPPRTKTE